MKKIAAPALVAAALLSLATQLWAQSYPTRPVRMVKEVLATVSAVPGTLSPEQFGTYLAKETREWGEIVRASGVKVE